VGVSNCFGAHGSCRFSHGQPDDGGKLTVVTARAQGSTWRPVATSSVRMTDAAFPSARTRSTMDPCRPGSATSHMTPEVGSVASGTPPVLSASSGRRARAATTTTGGDHGSRDPASEPRRSGEVGVEEGTTPELWTAAYRHFCHTLRTRSFRTPAAWVARSCCRTSV
jgi:hypothetical protein